MSTTRYQQSYPSFLDLLLSVHFTVQWNGVEWRSALCCFFFPHENQRIAVIPSRFLNAVSRCDAKGSSFLSSFLVSPGQPVKWTGGGKQTRHVLSTDLSSPAVNPIFSKMSSWKSLLNRSVINLFFSACCSFCFPFSFSKKATEHVRLI